MCFQSFQTKLKLGVSTWISRRNADEDTIPNLSRVTFRSKRAAIVVDIEEKKKEKNCVRSLLHRFKPTHWDVLVLTTSSCYWIGHILILSAVKEGTTCSPPPLPPPPFITFNNKSTIAMPPTLPSLPEPCTKPYHSKGSIHWYSYSEGTERHVPIASTANRLTQFNTSHSKGTTGYSNTWTKSSTSYSNTTRHSRTPTHRQKSSTSYNNTTTRPCTSYSDVY